MSNKLSSAEASLAKRYARINERAPAELRQAIANALVCGLSGKNLHPRDTLAELVARECPEIDAMAAAEGYRADFDLPANSYENMLKGHLCFTLTPIKKSDLH